MAVFTVMGRRGSILAVPFDLERLEVTGPPVPVVENVHTDTLFGLANFSVYGGAVEFSGGCVYKQGYMNDCTRYGGR